jgi:hypothetical protein
MVGARQRKRFGTVPGTDCCIAVRFEQIAEELHIELVVLHDKYARLASAGAPPAPLDRPLAFLVRHRFGPLDCGHRTNPPNRSL